MLVIQLTWGLFLVMMEAKYPQYTQEGLSLIWQEYERDEEEMPDDDFRISPVNVALTFNELSICDFVVYELNESSHQYFPASLKAMSDDEFIKVKGQIQAFLAVRFIGFTDLGKVVYRRR